MPQHMPVRVVLAMAGLAWLSLPAHAHLRHAGLADGMVWRYTMAGVSVVRRASSQGNGAWKIENRIGDLRQVLHLVIDGGGLKLVRVEGHQPAHPSEPEVLFPFPGFVGQSLTQSLVAAGRPVKIELRVVRQEIVQVPAGIFRATVVVRTVFLAGRPSLVETGWWAPETGLVRRTLSGPGATGPQAMDLISARLALPASLSRPGSAAAREEVPALVAQSRRLLADRQFPAAEWVASRVLRSHADSGSAWYVRGAARAGLDRHEEAIPDLGQALANGACPAGALVERARAHLQLRHYALALADLEAAVLADPAQQIYLRSLIERARKKSARKG